MTPVKLVILGGSRGGMRAVETILSALPRDFGVPVLVVLHRAEDSGDSLAAQLDRAGPLLVRDVIDKDPIQPGRVYLAPPGYHVLVEDGHLALSTDARVQYSRPSIDVALESGADALEDGLVGVVLTGGNEDGARGLARVRRRGGIAIVQDPACAEAPAMPAAARRAADPQAVADLPGIADLLARLGAGA